jgi:hypothetical protein
MLVATSININNNNVTNNFTHKRKFQGPMLAEFSRFGRCFTQV